MKEIIISDGSTVKVDDDDFLKLNTLKWSASGDGYAMRMEKDSSGTYRHIKMHRIVAKAKPGEIVDHINRDKSDNRKSNLRIVTKSQNVINSKLRSTNRSGYRGVFRRNEKWAAQISVDYKQIHLGYYRTKEEAALAYNRAAIESFGDVAVLNHVEGDDIYGG